MPETEYTKEELWKIYRMLPEDLKTAIFAGETAESISLACRIARVKKEKVSEVARYTGHVLMGLLPPDEFAQTLEKKVGLEPDCARMAAHQITRLVFNPLNESLKLIYEEKPKLVQKKEEEIEETLPKEKLKKKDIYREPIEES